MNRARQIASGLVLGVLVASSASAQEVYDRFVGVYVGRAEVLADDGSVQQIRDLDVTILKTEDGFGINSITVNHKGDRLSPDVVRRSSAMSFVESDIDGVFRRDFERDVFATRSEMDLIAGDPMQWARVVGDTLLVYSFILNDDGSYGLHTYDRTLDETGLSLGFVSESDGVIGREVQGRLIRVQDVMDDINP